MATLIKTTKTQHKIVASEAELTASICRESFFEFVKDFWWAVPGAQEPVWNWHIEFLCSRFQRAAELVFANKPRQYDIITNVPPGTTKSTIISILFPPWTWTRMPAARHICGSHTDKLVLDLSRKCREVVRSELYRACFPEIQLMEDQDTKGYWVNKKGGDRFSCTVGGSNPMGFHAHFLNIDDPIDPQKALSEAELKTANDFMLQTLPSRKIDKKVSVTFLTMQRLAQNDPTGLLLEKGGPVEHICLPAELTDDVKPAYLKKYYQNNLLDKVRLDQSVLNEYKMKGQYYYSGQFLQNPVPLGGGMFKVQRLTIDTAPIRFKRVFRYWDKAYTQEGGAYTVGAKLGLDFDNKFWVLDIVRGQWDSSEREKVIKLTANLDGYSVKILVEQEPAAGKESAANTIRNLAGFRVKADPRGGQNDGGKILRADAFASQVNAGNVYLAKAQWNQDYVEELRHFPHSTYKDQVDASSGAFNALAKTPTLIGAI